MIPILALDISGSTGWAAGKPDGEPQYGRHYPEHYQGEDIGRLVHGFGNWVDDMIWKYLIGHIVFEAPFYQGKNMLAARKIIGLTTEVERRAHVRDISCAEIDIATNKKFFAGNGRASKYQMTLAARSYGWEPHNNDEADTLGLWSYSCNARHPEIFGSRKLAADMKRLG